MGNVARLEDVVAVAVEAMAEAADVDDQTRSAFEHATGSSARCIILVHFVTTSIRHHATYLSIMFEACLPIQYSTVVL